MAEQIPFSIVKNVLSSLASSVVQKLGSMYGVGTELEKLEETLGTLNAVLLDAEEQLEKSHAVIDWVKRLKRVVYDVDDLLDDFATYRLRRRGPVRQVSHFFSCSSSSNQVGFRYQMSGRVEVMKESLDELKKDIFLLSVVPHNTILRPRAYNIGRETHSSPSISIPPGRRNVKKEEIVNLLVSPNNENVFIVAIVGIGGLGKTTLAQWVYDDERVKEHFKPLKYWVCVSDESGEGFGANALLKKITKSKTDESLDDLKKKLHEKISQKKYLLVLDDVWNNQSENWEKVRTLLEVGAKGSKILVTTRNTEISFMGKNTIPIKLEGLDEKESWELFSDITFGGQENTVNPEIIKVGKEIVNMCNGVPLIINTLGRTLMQFKSDLSKWLSIRKNENLLSLPYGNDNVLRVLRLSYDNLPTHLKQCFTYCALFPKDYEIEKKSLVQLWIAQGYIQSCNGNELLEDIGDRYFNELLSSSLLEEVKRDDCNNLLSCKMHDLIHDLAQSIVGSEIVGLRSEVSNISREVRHVSLFEKGNPMMKAIMGKPIRTFLNHSEYDPREASLDVNSFLPSFMCLRALSLNDLELEKVPKCLGKLIHLRYLDLSESKFEILPNSITRLKNLQTLKLQGCSCLKRFPENMRELINLRHLENDGCDELTHMPHGIGELTSLKSLPLFVIGEAKGLLRYQKVGSLRELECLDQIRGELRIENLENVRDVELASYGEILKEKEYLQSLRLAWRRWGRNEASCEGDKSVMEGLQPPPYLKELFIDGYAATEFPGWIMNGELDSLFPDLSNIEISSCSRCNALPPFSQLPSLKSLKLCGMKELVELKEELWWTEGPSFSQLSILEIDNCSNLASVELRSSPSLSSLKIDECNSLASLVLRSSSSLSNLEITECNSLASLELHSSPSLSNVKITQCNSLASLELHSSSSLLVLDICDCSILASLILHSSPSNLSRLYIKKCPDLASFNVGPFSSLETISLSTVGYNVITQIKFVSSSLKSLFLESIDGMNSLPKELCQHFCRLETLQINACPSFQSLDLLSFSSHSLSKLKIVNCPNLASFNVTSLSGLQELILWRVTAEALRQLMFICASSSLKSLCICQIDGMIAIPEEPLQYVSTLKTLYIVKCSGTLTPLLHWMGSLSSLTDLIIYDCTEFSQLTSLPEQIYSLQKLQELHLCDYPLLERRYNERTGQDKAKIAHIPFVSFDYDDLIIKIQRTFLERNDPRYEVIDAASRFQRAARAWNLP